MAAQPQLSFSLLIQLNLGIERTESHLMLKLSMDTVAVRLGILANPCPILHFATKYLFLFFVSSQIGGIGAIHKPFTSVIL